MTRIGAVNVGAGNGELSEASSGRVEFRSLTLENRELSWSCARTFRRICEIENLPTTSVCLLARFLFSDVVGLQVIFPSHEFSS